MIKKANRHATEQSSCVLATGKQLHANVKTKTFCLSCTTKKDMELNLTQPYPRGEKQAFLKTKTILFHTRKQKCWCRNKVCHQNVRPDRTDAFHHVLHIYSFWLRFCCFWCHASSSPLRKSKSHNPRTGKAINKVWAERWNESAEVRSYKVAKKGIYLLCVRSLFIL